MTGTAVGFELTAAGAAGGAGVDEEAAGAGVAGTAAAGAGFSTLGCTDGLGYVGSGGES